MRFGFFLLSCCLLILTGCDSVASELFGTPTPSPRPTVAASQTVAPIPPTQAPEMGVNNPTAAAAANMAGVSKYNDPIGVIRDSGSDEIRAAVTLNPTPTPDLSPRPFDVLAPEGAVLRGAYYPPDLAVHQEIVARIERDPAESYAGTGDRAPAVLLLHGIARQKEDWDAFATFLQERGFGAAAVDLRGHGETGGAVDWALAEGDVLAALDALAAMPDVDGMRVFIMGADIGANLALRACATSAECAGAVMVSPGLDYRGVTVTDALTVLPEGKPIFIYASKADTYSAESARTLYEQAGEAAYFELFGGGAHGVDLLEAQRPLWITLADLLNLEAGRWMP
jgi:dienelactone hydrolase